jgi:hypothetical protein
MRAGTTIAIAALLALILIAGTLSLFFQLR